MKKGKLMKSKNRMFTVDASSYPSSPAENRGSVDPNPKCVLLRKGAVVPKKANPEDAGFDLCYCPEVQIEASIYAGHRSTLETGISVAIPPGYYGRIAPRSGLAVKEGIDVLAGVVDASYRGEVKVVLLNTNTTQTNSTMHHYVSFKPGDRIAQLIIEKIHAAREMEVVDSLDDTQRGAGGFGSTGL